MSKPRRFFRLPIHRRSAWEREVEEEILLHLSLRAESLAKQGMTAEQARDEAMRRFGPMNESRAQLLDAARHREEQMMRTEFLQDLKQDLSFAFRTLGRNRGWAAITVGTLALGIGATTAVWSAASTLLLHPVRYPHAERIVNVELQPTGGNKTGIKVSVTPGGDVVRAWRESSRNFEALEPWGGGTGTLTGVGEGTSINVGRILPSFVAFAGERPVLGTGFTDGDVRDKVPVAVLGEALWRTRFGGDSGVIGRMVTVDGVARRIVGVYPSTLKTPLIGGSIPDVWIPVNLGAQRQGYRVVGRLRPGVTVTQAQQELTRIKDRPELGAAKLPFTVVVAPPQASVRFRDSLLLLAGAVGLVLLVACANIAHLLLARGIARERELAIRAALGAARSRLTRLLMTESFMLAIVGSTLGILLGVAGLRVAVALRPSSLIELRDAHIDGTGLALVLGAALVCALLFGAANMLNVSRRAATDSLRGGVSSARQGERLRSLLVVSEMAMSGLLLVGAVLLVRTVINLQATPLGFDPKNLHGITLDLPKDKYPSAAAKTAAITEVEAQLARSPHIKAITVANNPFDGLSFNIGALEVQGEPTPPPSTSNFIQVEGVQADWFRTIGAHFADGGTFTDTSSTSKQVIINTAFARKHWKGQSPLGERIRVSFNGGQAEWQTIVGVVDDIQAIGPVVAGEVTAPKLFFTRNEHDSPTLMVRTDGSPDAFPAILAAARLLKPSLAPSIQSAAHVVSSGMASQRFIMSLLAAFTILAVILSAIGLYGVMSYSVAQRTREIGIRIALGATPSEIGWSVLARGTVLALVGAAAGLGFAVWGTRLLESQLYGVKPLDVMSFGIGAGLLVVTAIAACVVPTRRAIEVDPIRAIRAD